MTITLELTPDQERKIQQAARVQGKDVTAFLIDCTQQKLRPDVLPENDTRLLEIINAPIAPEAKQQRDALLQLQSQRELTNIERDTLTYLIDTVEIANAARWQSLADLAELRGLSLAEIAQQLEIPLS